MKKMPVTIKYRLGHTRTEDWMETSYFCLACGEKDVWMECGGGDYYQGSNHICATCGSIFPLPVDPYIPEPKDERSQIIDQIRARDTNGEI